MKLASYSTLNLLSLPKAFEVFSSIVLLMISNYRENVISFKMLLLHSPQLLVSFPQSKDNLHRFSKLTEGGKERINKHLIICKNKNFSCLPCDFNYTLNLQMAHNFTMGQSDTQSVETTLQILIFPWARGMGYSILW